MNDRRPSMLARISAETSASAHLHEACHWVIECQTNRVRLEVDDLPALGCGSTLIVGRPITAARAVMCALWLLEDVVGGACLLAGRIRFLAHPTDSGIRLSFSGRAATATGSGLPLGQVDQAARQLLDVVAKSLGRRRAKTSALGPPVSPGIELYRLLAASLET
jgi:hypothetical protein